MSRNDRKVSQPQEKLWCQGFWCLAVMIGKPDMYVYHIQFNVIMSLVFAIKYYVYDIIDALFTFNKNKDVIYLIIVISHF